ncbi:MAG: hypothetical protein GX175_01045 [Halanaerobiaceae bacterium]|nr:hypothetical protein [Halanaerobiaceae bacterium]
MSILSNINKSGTTIMLVTHDAKVAAQAKPILFMKAGNIVRELQLTKYDGRDFDDRYEKITAIMRETGI